MAERIYPTSEVGAMAGMSYPPTEVSGGWEEPLCAGGQGLHLRPGAVVRRSNPRSGGCTGTGGPRGAIPC